MHPSWWHNVFSNLCTSLFFTWGLCWFSMLHMISEFVHSKNWHTNFFGAFWLLWSSFSRWEQFHCCFCSFPLQLDNCVCCFSGTSWRKWDLHASDNLYILKSWWINHFFWNFDFCFNFLSSSVGDKRTWWLRRILLLGLHCPSDTNWPIGSTIVSLSDGAFKLGTRSRDCIWEWSGKTSSTWVRFVKKICATARNNAFEALAEFG